MKLGKSGWGGGLGAGRGVLGRGKWVMGDTAQALTCGVLPFS